jgi:hypothetical protein
MKERAGAVKTPLTARTTRAMSLGFFALVGVACTTTTSSSSTAPTSSDADAGEAEPAPSDTANPADAAPPAKRKEKKGELVRAPIDKAESCDAACGRLGTTCAVACDGTAGATTFKNNGGGWDQESVASCSEPIVAPALAQGDAYSSKSCCCMLPPIETKQGDPDKPTSCAAVCSAAGLACDSFGNEGSAAYDTGGGAPCKVGLACDRPPPVNDRCGSGRGPLVELSCPCR